MRKSFDAIQLALYLLKHSLAFKILDVFLPFFRSTKIAEVAKKKFTFQKELSVEIVRLDINFCPEKDDIMELYLFFTVAYEKSFSQKVLLVVFDLGR